MAKERAYDEIFEAIREAREQRGARGPRGPKEVTRQLRQAFMTGGEDAVIAVFEQHPELAEMCPADGMTMLHQVAGRGVLKVMTWLIDHGADVNRRAVRTDWHAAWTPLEFAATGQGGEWVFDVEKFQQVAALLLDRGAQLTPLPAAALGRVDFLATCSKEEMEGRGVLEAAVRGNQFEALVLLLDKGLDVDERMQVGNLEEQNWTAGGPLFQAVVLKRMDMVRLLLERGADPNANVFTSGSPTFRAYDGGDAELIGLMVQHGGKLDPGSAGYARNVDMARKMLAGEIDAPFEPSDFSGHTVAEQLLWGGASSSCAEIVRMALEHVTMAVDDPRWFNMLWRPMPSPDGEGNTDEGVECFRMILARCGPHHLGGAYKQTMLHEVMSRNADLRLAELLLDAGAKLDIRDCLLQSTPLGWACRWGRLEHVKLLLARGADPAEADAEPWATPRAWAEKMGHSEIMRLLG